ncbi:hypothetical protein J167_01506 [Xanthomonas citri pv. citri]|nr:hypothetical protein J165_01505 [Xanthomonas citri pv. citri]AJZ48265.1 hypothetical protein J166_01508 [Xanthomonas citri pv. citri]AJZ52883.1 hypothetical protein J167_01506 [Xanthomonas citri pv. citri]AJZ65679.1 hypothetical protein J168_01507 [Xanthomonas citri pv. citri]
MKSASGHAAAIAGDCQHSPAAAKKVKCTSRIAWCVPSRCNARAAGTQARGQSPGATLRSDHTANVVPPGSRK